MIKLIRYISISLLCVGCSANPYEQGAQLAAKYDECVAEYDKAFERVGEDFARQIPGNYNSRTKAMEDYIRMLSDCHKEYLCKWRDVAQEERKIRKEMKSVADLSDFETGLTSNRENDIFCNEPNLETMPISPAILKQVRAIIPPKPTEQQITKDMVGHSLSEGKRDGYYPQWWKWEIKEDGISELHILSVEENTNSRYTVIVAMYLNSDTRAFNAKAQVSYSLSDISDWQIEFVQSKGMDIVKTHRYDDCVRCYFGLGRSVIAENNSEIALEVAGRALYYSGEWSTFCAVIPPHQYTTVSYNRADFRVDYVERP